MSDRPRCSPAECGALIDRFLPPLADLPDDVRNALRDGSSRSSRDTMERLGRCLWDIFSHDHEVVDAAGRAHDLGSFRGTGDFLAHRMALRYPAVHGFDYTDFYMGTRGAEGPAAVYEWIFRGLKEAGCDWIYAFPRIHLLHLGDPARPERDDPAFRAFAASLERAHVEAVRKARELPLPAMVAAYRKVYGRLPEGWPHPDM